MLTSESGWRKKDPVRIYAPVPRICLHERQNYIQGYPLFPSTEKKYILNAISTRGDEVARLMHQWSWVVLPGDSAGTSRQMLQRSTFGEKASDIGWCLG